jgi:hypothetical protein
MTQGAQMPEIRDRRSDIRKFWTDFYRLTSELGHLISGIRYLSDQGLRQLCSSAIMKAK